MHVNINSLRPNNWYINQQKLDNVRVAWQNGQQDQLPPVLVTTIDGELSLIDGHSRTFAALEHGATNITAIHQPLETISGQTALYIHIHRAGPSQGICSVRDLATRIVSQEAHRLLWISYCEQWIAENLTE